MLASVVSAIAFASLFEYQVTVKAPAQIRPEGEIRVVEAAKAGKISQIAVKQNQKVKQGDIIAYLDDLSLNQDRQQLINNLQATQAQLTQLQILIEGKKGQIEAEKKQIDNRTRYTKTTFKLAFCSL